jgi:hypothetical protein
MELQLLQRSSGSGRVLEEYGQSALAPPPLRVDDSSEGETTIEEMNYARLPGATMIADGGPELDQIATATFSPPGSIRLQFADGYTGTARLADIPLRPADIKPRSIRVAMWGNAVTVKNRRGETIHIDSSVLRAIVDSRYATALRRAIDDLARGIDAPPRL